MNRAWPVVAAPPAATVRRAEAGPIPETICSESNSQLKIGVGPARAPWRCQVSRKGIVADVTSRSDEGKL